MKPLFYKILYCLLYPIESFQLPFYPLLAGVFHKYKICIIFFFHKTKSSLQEICTFIL